MNKKIVIPLFLGSLLACLFLPLHVLQVKAMREGAILFVRRIRTHEQFVLEYIHSVEHCRVWDHIKIDERFRLVLHETVFSSSNTGLPAILSAGEHFSSTGGRFRISGMHRVLSGVTLWVDEKYDNTLTIGEDQVLKLPSLAGNTLLRIETRKMALFEFMVHKVKGMVN